MYTFQHTSFKISQFIIYKQLNIIYTSFILISYIQKAYIIIRVNGPGTRVDRVWKYFFIYTIKAFIFLQNNNKSSVYIEKKPSPEITYNMLRSHCEINKSIEVYFNRNHDHSHDFIEIVIFTLFQACVTLSRLFYTFFSRKPTKNNSQIQAYFLCNNYSVPLHHER